MPAEARQSKKMFWKQVKTRRYIASKKMFWKQVKTRRYIASVQNLAL